MLARHLRIHVYGDNPDALIAASGWRGTAPLDSALTLAFLSLRKAPWSHSSPSAPRLPRT